MSIKTVNFRDPKTNRYTKNYTRVDNELRAEALDYHVRQPYSVLVAAVFIPDDACSDAEPLVATGKKRRKLAPGDEAGVSSFGASVKIFRHRAGRGKPKDEEQLFERVFVGLYSVSPPDVRFVDVMWKPPRAGTPARTLSFDEFVLEIVATYNQRNDPPFEWA